MTLIRRTLIQGLVPAFFFIVSCCPYEVYIRDLGVIPDTGQDVTASFRNALEHCRDEGVKVLKLEQGVYDFWPEHASDRDIFVSNTSSETECPSKVKHIGLLIEDMRNFTIDGDGATLIFHGKQSMIAIIHSKDITLRNFHIDCLRPCGSEMIIDRAEAGEVVLRFNPDSWYEINENGQVDLVGEGWKTEHPHCVEYDPEQDRMYHTRHWDILQECQARELEHGLVSFAVEETDSYKVGNIITVRDRFRDEVGILNLENEGVIIEDVGIHYLHAIGVVSQFSKDVTMRRVCCEPREGSGRILASSADFFHFSGCAGKVRIIDCRFSGAQDDPVNIHGTYLRVEDIPANDKVRVRFMHHQTYGMQAFWPGDSVSFVSSASLATKAKTAVKCVERLNDYEVLLTLEDAVPASIIPLEDVVENLTWTPEVEIRGCRFTRTSTRGTLVSTPRKVVIENNDYIRTGMSAILISGDANGWYESGAVKDVIIRNNRFIDCARNGGHHDAVISIDPTNRLNDPDCPVHSGIRIIGNVFETWGNDPVYAYSAGDILMEGNVVHILQFFSHNAS